MFPHRSAFLPLDARPRDSAPPTPQRAGSVVDRALARRFALLILSSIALFGGLPLWLDLIAEFAPEAASADWLVHRLLVVVGTVGAILLGLFVATTWVRLVKQLARTDWDV